MKPFTKIIGKISNIPLIIWIVLAIVLGLLMGLFSPTWFVNGFCTFNAIFNQLLGFFIPLIIFGLVTPAIAGVGSQAPKLLAITVAISYASTVCSGLFSYGISSHIFPALIQSGLTHESTEGVPAFSPFFTLSITPIMDVITALVLSFMLGIGIVSTNAQKLKHAFDEFQNIVTATISHVIVPLLPIYIFGMFLLIAAQGDAAHTMVNFLKVIVVNFVLTLVFLLIQYCIAGLIANKNPLKSMITMLPAYVTALGTASSAATIPVTLKQTIQNGVNPQIAGFVIPLCATIHLSGSVLKIVACSIAVMISYNMPFDFGLFIGFIFLLAITAVAAPGVPGGMIMAALGVLNSILGFGSEQQALMITLYIIMDSFGTACNITGDGAISLIIDRISINRKA